MTRPWGSNHHPLPSKETFKNFFIFVMPQKNSQNKRPSFHSTVSGSCENQMCNCRIPGQLWACWNRETVITTSRIRDVGKGMFICTVWDTRQQSHSDILSAFQSYFLFHNHFLWLYLQTFFCCFHQPRFNQVKQFTLWTSGLRHTNSC